MSALSPAAETLTKPPAEHYPPDAVTRPCGYADLGRIEYGAAWDVQRQAVSARKQGLIADRLLFAEHPDVITIGRGGKRDHLLVSEHELERRGIALWETDRGGDITYHGPGQLVGYPILDLREWKRDVVAYLRALEQVLIGAAGDFGISAGRLPGCTGVWAGEAKLAAMGVHVSRWVTSHGFALNVTTDLRQFGCIIPCGLAKPVTSIEQLLGEAPPRTAVRDAVKRHFGRVFGREMTPVNPKQDSARPNLTSERQ